MIRWVGQGDVHEHWRGYPLGGMPLARSACVGGRAGMTVEGGANSGPVTSERRVLWVLDDERFGRWDLDSL
jgi:hypothetical protein